MSAQQSYSSHKVLEALETGGADNVRAALFAIPKGLLRTALLKASYEHKYALRTPLMVAAKGGDFAVFTIVMRYIERLFQRNPVSKIRGSLQLGAVTSSCIRRQALGTYTVFSL